MSQVNPPNILAVKKSLLVHTSIENAFRVFTEQHGAWWPKGHHIGASVPQTAIIEPYVGGRWFERAEDGAECDWGRVLVWDPPHRLVLTWDIGADWKFDPNLGTEVDIRFIAETADTTRVELEHRKLDRFGTAAEKIRAVFDSEGGWGGILREYARVAG
jgi:uncharacterized protein YndB with AHSA1/START domain